MMNRLLFIDYAKGIAILLLLLSHSIVGYGPLKTWISAFNMPIFFIICGYLCYFKYPQGFVLSQSTNYLKKRIKNIWYPYFIFCFILIIFFNALKLISHSPITIISSIKNVFFFYGIESMWFLPVYFFSEFIFLLLCRKLSFTQNTILCLLIITILSLSENFIPNSFIQIKRTLIGYVFIFSGYVCARNNIHNKMSPILSITLLFLFSIIAFYMGFSSMSNTNIPLVYIVNAIIISIALLSLLTHVNNTKKRLTTY